MKINKITPQGYCNGVKNAYNTVINILKDPNTKRPVTLLGDLIHNEFVMNELKTLGAVIINNNFSRLEMLDLVNEGTVVFSAHGVSKDVYEKAKNKNLIIVDTTCPYVSLIHNKIDEYTKDGYDIIYIGTNNHPECEGVLESNKHINLVTNIDDINKLSINNDKIYVTNQTTLSLFDLNDMYEIIKNKYPNAIIDNKICNATTLRQEAVINQEPVDLCIVVGDKKSSNTNKLAYSAKKAGINTILIESANELINYNFTDINSVSVTSGASVPSYLVDDVIEYLSNKSK
jgi:4-hydroxy-3-methylbut-2-enyl diphosphate reductase